MIPPPVVERIVGFFFVNECQGLQSDEAIDMSEEDDLADNEGGDDDLTCFICLKGDVSDDNGIVICDGDHSEPRGCHQFRYQPTLQTGPDGHWFCPHCQQDEASAPPSRGIDGD